jgi:ABC-type multidrug transport system fused ATPase/permease subunit
VQAFRREPRNDELHAQLNEENRQAHHRAFWLMAVFVPAVGEPDRVLVMDGGRLVEDGSPAGLVAGTGRFADLHRAWADSLG